ncbi:PREDICTED: protein FAM136A-like [Nicrophorus vespilloides]|uniref:Protein FAM136A-like n=1 Tax=Nicrophorus vespilloides TaxID=110193 RepID=A0ABM1MPP8_NICVS|nr:PREDICTED: protein FAM136A-like [Nicrophorus vespilloides]
MVEQQRQRVEQEMTKLVDELDKQYLRQMQADMHRCAAKCCDDKSVSLERVQQCVEHCSGPLNKSQGYVQSELEGLQNRLQRCVMECNDDIKLKMGPNPSESEVNRYSLMFENCAVKCVDKHVELIPSVMKAMKTVLAKHKKESV